MTDWARLERSLTDDLGLTRRPVAVAFLDSEPANIPKFDGSQPSSCGFWRVAAEGATFYTTPEAHYNCAIGSYTHNIPLPVDRANELEGMLALMFGLEYVRPEEVPTIPRLSTTPRAIVYSPLGATPVDPDVVLFACRPASAMLLNEATMRAGAAAGAPLLGRPSCMALPAALTGGTTISLGCVGNRVYTGLQDDELYVVVPGKSLASIAASTAVITEANTKLQAYAQSRRAELSR